MTGHGRKSSPEKRNLNNSNGSREAGESWPPFSCLSGVTTDWQPGGEADEGQSELDYALGRFTARMVAHIPDKILNDHKILVANRVDDASFEYDYADRLFDDEN